MAKEIQFFGSIFQGFDPFSGTEALSASWLAKELDGAGDVELLINSDGGSIFEAKAQVELLARHKGHVTANVVSLAASSASFLLAGADSVQIAPGAHIMIHNAYTWMMGDAAELRAQADVLDSLRDNTIIPHYQERTSLSADQLRDMMAAETWMSSDEAVANGFADSLSREPNTPQVALLRPGMAKNAPDGIVALSSGDYRKNLTQISTELRAKSIATPIAHRKQMIAEFREKRLEEIDSLT